MVWLWSDSTPLAQRSDISTACVIRHIPLLPPNAVNSDHIVTPIHSLNMCFIVYCAWHCFNNEFFLLLNTQVNVLSEEFSNELVEVSLTTFFFFFSMLEVL